MRFVLPFLLLLVACDDPVDPLPDTGTDAAPIDAGPELHPEIYPGDPTPWTPETCAADQDSVWILADPGACATGRSCIDGNGRTWAAGEPWIVRGVYHGGRELETLLTNCPAGADCEATQAADHADYVRILADAGINVILENRMILSPEILAAIDAEPRMGIAHLLFDDPFTVEGHDRLVAQIEAVAEDPNVMLWFGPDEPDLNRTWPMATGIARLLRGANAQLDGLLAGRYRPAASMPFLPADEPAHDPYGLPYTSAVVIDSSGLAVATDVYDIRTPVTYPFQERYSRADDTIWTIERISRFDEPEHPSMPVLQMVELEGLNLIRPSPGQIRAQIMGAIVHGGDGAYYFKIAGDDPAYAGRSGWFAADDVDGWATYTEMHALWDRSIPVLYSDATQEPGTHGILHYRRYTLGSRRVLMIVNPTPYQRWVDLDAIVERADDEYVRSWDGCGAFTTRALEVPPYAIYVLEVVPAPEAVPGDPGDPLDGTVPPRPALPMPAALSGTWETGAVLTLGRSAHAAVVGDEVVLIGGYTGADTASRSVERYPTETALTDLPTPVASAAAMLAADGSIVVAGGVPRFPTMGIVVPRTRCQRFDGSSWSRCADLGNGPTSNAPHVTYFDDLYLFGGLVHLDFDMGNTVTLVAQRYDPGADAWRAETHLPEIRSGAAAMVHDGIAYLVGGFGQPDPGGPSSLTGVVLAYDLHEQRWLDPGDPRELGDLPTPRSGLACASHAGYGYCVGGFDSMGDNLTSAERVDFATGEWTALDPLPAALSDTVAVVHDGALHVIGGLDARYNDANVVYVMR